jgi:hypothetical protein
LDKWNSINTARINFAGAGTQTAALAFGGATPTITGATEHMMEHLGYQFLLWQLQDQVYSGAGTQTAGLAFGGLTPTVSTATEEWSGPQTTATASTLTTS